MFENFATNDGDFLRAKFRAFKFPESSYVLFKGTVNVCLNTCNPVSFIKKIFQIISKNRGSEIIFDWCQVRCSNGEPGYGRRRRDVSSKGADPNKVYTISMSTIIKMECDDCGKAEHIEKGPNIKVD